MKVHDHQSLAGGLLLTAVGIFATVHAARYTFGSISHMGPGFFPTILGALLTMLGMLIFLLALKSRIRTRIQIRWRGLNFVLIAIVVFSLTLENLGLIPSVFITVILASMSDPNTDWRQRLILSVCITLFTVLVFKYLLGMILPLGWW